MIQLVAILSVLGIGIVFSILGAVKLSLTERLKIDDAKFGSLISVLMFSSIILVLLIGPLVDTFGHKPIAVIGFLVAGASIFLLAYSGSYKMAVASCIGLGIGGMCVNTVGNTLLPLVLFGGENPPAASNLGNVFFGMGAFLTPFVVGMLLKRLGFSNTLSIIGGIVLIPIIFAFMTTSYPELPGYEIGSAFNLLGTPVVLVASLILFFYIALEVSMGGWITSYLKEVGLTDAKSTMVLSAFWIALMVARLVTSQFITPDIGAWAITLLSLVSIATIFLMIIAKNKAMAIAGVLVTGLALGPVFPTVVGYTFAKIPQEVYGSAFAIMFAVGLLGGTTVPKAIGNYAEGKTIRKSLIILVVTAAILTVVSIIFRMV
ncbi:MAG: MFS transporter [bacterium]|nr:MFS transporter [bacterium]